MTLSYDIVGDIHGHLRLLEELCAKLGYDSPLSPPTGRKLVFVGDFADRGTDNLGTILAVRKAVLSGRALAVLGNHDYALLRWLQGGEKPKKGGIEETMAEIENSNDPSRTKDEIRRFYEMLPLLLRLDDGRLIVAHAGVEADQMARPLTHSDQRFVLNGDAIGKREDGKTLRRDWAADYSGDAFVVYGHTPQDEIVLRPNSVNIDSGVYVTGTLTALRWPERELISVSGVAGTSEER